jgi:hypothetical protein
MMQIVLVREIPSTIEERVAVEFPLHIKKHAGHAFDSLRAPYGESYTRYERTGEQRYRLTGLLFSSDTHVTFWSDEDTFIPDWELIERTREPGAIVTSKEFAEAMGRFNRTSAAFQQFASDSGSHPEGEDPERG